MMGIPGSWFCDIALALDLGLDQHNRPKLDS
jgi:hypothetical protein